MRLRKMMAALMAATLCTGILVSEVPAAGMDSAAGGREQAETAVSLGNVTEHSLKDTITDDGVMVTTGDESLVNRDNHMSEREYPSAYTIDGAGPDDAVTESSGENDVRNEALVGDAYRHEGNITSVVNQSGSSLCWSISALDSAQINLGIGGQQLFSAYHLACSAFAGQGDTWNLQGETFVSHGGNFQIAGSTLARWYGAASEADYPEDDSMLLSESERQSAIAHLTSLERLTDPNPGRSTTASAQRSLAEQTAADIKAALTAGSTVCVDYAISGYKTLSGKTVLYHGSYRLPTHQSVIVGWDDDVDTGASRKGAYLVKNSWGSSWGEEQNGYLWLSYYDRSLTNPCIYQLDYSAAGSLADQDIYSYDGTGYYAYLTAGSGESLKSANIFSASNNETIDHVGVYVPAGGSATLTVRKGNELDHGGLPDAGQEAATATTGTKTYAGFYVVALDRPVYVQKSRRFAVECQIRNASGNDMAYFEYSRSGDESATRTVVSHEGETFCTGDSGDYIDIKDSNRSYLGNACIKAYGTTSDRSPVRYTMSLSTTKPYLTASAEKNQNRPMYRMYNPNSGEHFYTANASERTMLFQAGWNEEGIGWYAPKTGVPVYRLYNPNAGDHHYTLSVGERNSLVSAGWQNEGIGWYSGGPNPLYRQYNPNAKAGSHNYTLSAGERNSLIKAGWRDEGIGWYGYS